MAPRSSHDSSGESSGSARYAHCVRTHGTTTIRPFDQRDDRFLRGAAREAFAEYDGAEAEQHVLAMVHRSSTYTLIAEQNGRAVGFAIVSVDGAEAGLQAIAVVGAWRGCGIGQSLLGAAERFAAGRGANTIRLETGEANLAAIHLFVRFGYEPAGRIAGYYRVGYDALRFRKRLGPRSGQ